MHRFLPLFLLVLCAAPVSAAAPATGPAFSEGFHPDRERSGTLGHGEQRRNTLRLQPGKTYPVVQFNRKKSHVLVAHPLDPDRTGWVRFAPAELLAPRSDMAEGRAYSSGWARLYAESGTQRDESLKEKLRDLNRNLWTLGYDAARDVMYSSLDNRDGMLHCVYTALKFPAGKRPGAGPDGEFMNTEHTWPQGQFNKKEPMRSDLHHLYPTESQSNHDRGSKNFRELGDNEGVAIGEIGARTTQSSFEAPAAHKGNVARAMFYFSVQYRRALPKATERVLREWHTADPVDATEVARNQGIYEYQNSRNYFVDHPEYVDQISDF